MPAQRSAAREKLLCWLPIRGSSDRSIGEVGGCRTIRAQMRSSGWRRAPAIYVTHEHPDHFHMPSIRRLGSGPAYLFPSLAEQGYLAYMAQHGYRAEAVPPSRWRAIGESVSILSIPVWNDDSLLLVDTPSALILNLNDAKPPPPVLRAIRRLADQIGKPRILLCSYSPASCINSFLDETGGLSR